MDQLLGWSVTTISTVSGSYSDLLRKKYISGVNVWDNVAIINFFGFFYILLSCFLTNAFPLQINFHMVFSIFITSIFKIIAQASYYKSVTLAPLSTSLPYLSWNSLFLLLSGYIYLNEVPNYLGIIGCILIMIGVYIKQMDYKTSELNKESYHIVDIFGIKIKLGGGFFMMMVCLIWTYTTTQEKYIMVHMNISPTFLLLVQRVFMSLPMVILRYIIAKKQFVSTVETLFSKFAYLSLIENISTGFHFKGMELLYVSYVTATKRAGSIILSTFLGYKYLEEKITNACILSNLAMSFGIVFVIFGR